MSEDLVQSATHQIGHYGYIRLGSTRLSQLKRSKYIQGKLDIADEARKPDGIVFLPSGGIKAVIEVKQPKELVAKELPSVIDHYSQIAKAVCNVLIITDGKNSYWINPHTKEYIKDETGHDISLLFDPKAIEGKTLSLEKANKISSLIEQAAFCINETNNHITPLNVIDPSGLARTVWQKIWINTGKEPEKCLYNVVEIFLFKFLSDTGVLIGNYGFQRVLDLIIKDGPVDALNHYANISRKKIKALFPPGTDNTTVINGTIFVNEQGDPNTSQASLFAEVIQLFQNFDDKHGSMRHINREFKTRLYESFLRQEAGVKSLGQYFTPRNVVQAVVKMSSASSLKDGARICDPFCGVGGFVLETIVENKNIFNQYTPSNGKIEPKIILKGYDKGSDEKEDERTIILAKANMLIYFSDLLAQYNSEAHLKEFSEKAFNAVFELLRSNLGTFGRHDDEPYDLILTNPPYVTSGSASLKNSIEFGGANKFLPLGRGTEALAIQWIVNNLKVDGEALVIIPDGLLNQASILNYLTENCFIRGVVALPSRTFYSTPKKTYILVINKKESKSDIQEEPVFTYLVSEIGESRDARRVPIKDNDLTEMEMLFRQFNATRKTFVSSSPRCKVFDFDVFKNSKNWLIDRLWTKDEKKALGIVDERVEVDEAGFLALAKEANDEIQKFLTTYNGNS
ncbi:HsdM family class I SAM-dependent methyltransferase [Hymenobacter fodinae]|uniref:site-specific DNA-methyltransferase (adenine-specific) n=1 Tax=Hymenobacter fodinae TaxID=2510796 RepID=A0A4Z0P067_9BACT|nr:N-6 DNA methylase [Hymenobacter fodinae]TGE04644.1 N-6 DNA methylase [Hymenobacter fodinae]